MSSMSMGLQEDDFPIPEGFPTYFLRRDKRLGRRRRTVKAKGWRFYQDKTQLGLALAVPRYLEADPAYAQLQEAVAKGLRPVRDRYSLAPALMILGLNGALVVGAAVRGPQGHSNAFLAACLSLFCLCFGFYLLTRWAAPRPLVLTVQGAPTENLPEGWEERLLAARFHLRSQRMEAESSSSLGAFIGTFGAAYPRLSLVSPAPVGAKAQASARARKRWMREQHRVKLAALYAAEAELLRYSRLPEGRKWGERLLQLEERAAVLHLVRLGGEVGLPMEQKLPLLECPPAEAGMA